MSADKWPPLDDKKGEDLKDIAVERFENTAHVDSLDKNKIVESQVVHDAKERMSEETGYKISAEDQGRIKEIQKSFTNPDTTARDQINSAALKRPLGDESYTAYEGTVPESPKRNWGRAGKIFAGLLGLFGAHQAGATDVNATADKIFSDSTKNIRTEKTFTDSTDTKKVAKVGIYTQSKTKEGSITPTGLSNSFYENEFGITESDIGILAEKYGFRTGSQLEFQSDLVDYMAQHYPDAINGVMEKYGKTNKGSGLEGLKDDMLGGRTSFLMGLLKNGSAELTIDGKKITYSTSTPENIDGGPKHHGGETFETDGYQKLVVLFDNSPSMYKHRAFLAEQLGSNTSDVDVDVVGFSNKVDATMTFPTPKDASRELANITIVDQNQELAVDVLAQKLESMEVQQGKTKVVVCTDEALQNVRAEKLAEIQKLCSEKNIDVTFSVIIDDIPYTLTLEDVQESYKTVIDGFTKSIQLREKQIQEFEASLKVANGKTERELKNQIKQNQEEIKYYSGFLNGSGKINLDKFEKEQSSKSIASK